MFVSSHQSQFELHLVIRHGSVFDPPSRDGTALITAKYMSHLFNRKASFLSLETSQQNALSFETKVTYDAIYFKIAGQSQNLKLACQCLSDVLSHPEFSDDIFHSVKERVLLDLVKEEDSPEIISDQAWRSILFSPSPYAHGSFGSATSMGNLELQDVIKYFRRCFLPNRSILFISAPISQDEFRGNVTRYFGSWVKAKAPNYVFAKPDPYKNPKTMLIDIPRAEEGCIMMGYLGLTKKHQDFPSFAVLKVILEERLKNLKPSWDRYQFIIQNIGIQFTGYFRITITGPPDLDPEICNKVLSVLESFARGEVSLEEFRNAKQKVLQDFSKQASNINSRNDLLIQAELFRLGILFIKNYPDYIESVIKEDIEYIVGNYLSSEKVKIVISSRNAQKIRNRLSPEYRPLESRIWGME